MVQNRLCASWAASVIVAVAFFSGDIAEKSMALDLSLIERGSGDHALIGLWVSGFGNSPYPGETTSLTSPSGDVFTSSSILEDGLISDLLFRFDSVSEALTFVSGTWEGVRRGPFPNSPVEEYVFNIDGIPIAAINQTAPTLISPLPGQRIKNGSTFEFGWDYVTSGEAPDVSRYTVIPQFGPQSSSSSSIVATPRPGANSSSSVGGGSGDHKFMTTRRNVPGTDKNRFLNSFEAAAAALPLDVALTLGSYTELEDFVLSTNGVGLFYSREIDPFTVTLTVPEPSSLGLAVAMALTGCPVRRRSRA